MKSVLVSLLVAVNFMVNTKVNAQDWEMEESPAPRYGSVDLQLEPEEWRRNPASPSNNNALRQGSDEALSYPYESPLDGLVMGHSSSTRIFEHLVITAATKYSKLSLPLIGIENNFDDSKKIVDLFVWIRLPLTKKLKPDIVGDSLRLSLRGNLSYKKHICKELPHLTSRSNILLSTVDLPFDVNESHFLTLKLWLELRVTGCRGSNNGIRMTVDEVRTSEGHKYDDLIKEQQVSTFDPDPI